MQANWLGEIVEELLDVAQTTITMAFKLEDDFGVSLEEGLDRHIDKLKRKNYLIS
jgi:NTP pyrophosphatase (non-canonical NTP hydrolase)